MKISARSRYGLRAMVCLAKMGKISPANLIAEKEGIPPDYLEKIFIKLKKAGLVKTVRGAQGGYALARPAQKIAVGRILQVLEGSLAPVFCVARGKEKKFSCPRRNTCPTKDVWNKIHSALEKALHSITLKDLIK